MSFSLKFEGRPMTVLESFHDLTISIHLGQAEDAQLHCMCKSSQMQTLLPVSGMISGIVLGNMMRPGCVRGALMRAL